MEEEIQPQEQTETQTEEEIEEEDDDNLPFPRARIVNLMRNEIVGGKQIRSEVKEAVNIWLGNLLKTISREMGNTQYGSVGMSDFQRATKPYDMISDIVKDEERLLAGLEKLKLDADHLIREMSRFFAVLKSKPQQEL